MNQNNVREEEHYPRITGVGGQGTGTTSMMALDGLVAINSIFLIAVFVGLSLDFPLENNSGCHADLDVACDLLVFELGSFSFFLFSILVAQGLKLAIYQLNTNNVDDAFRASNNSRVLRLGMIATVSGSVMGFIFLLLSILNIFQIRLGMLYCGSLSSF